MEAPPQVEIGGHHYQVDREELIAERYSDGVELRIYPVSRGGDPQSLRASFVRIGARGAIHTAAQTYDEQDLDDALLRLADARRHLALIASWMETGAGRPMRAR